MDDLAGLDWSTPDSKSNINSPPKSTANYFPTLKPTPPVSGRSTPALLPQPARSSNASNVPSKAPTPQNDSFASLLPFNAPQNTRTVSLQEQQKLLQEQRQREELDRQKQWNSQFASTARTASINTEGGKTAPDQIHSPPGYAATSEYGGQKLSTTLNKPFAAIPSTLGSTASRKPSESEADILAAFSSTAPVDRSTNFPIPSESRSSSFGPSSVLKNAKNHMSESIEDDDPFGLGTATVGQVPVSSKPVPAAQDDDDVLGLLGKPVSELPPRSTSPAAPGAPADPMDRAVAELVDMGFSAEKSTQALLATGPSTDVQAAVGWLLNQAHADSRSKSQTPVSRGRDQDAELADQPSNADSNQTMPAWMRQQSRSTSGRRPDNSRSSSQVDKDPAKYAAELGNNFLKTANSLWKTGAKKINKAVTEFNSEADSSEPKWMRGAQNKHEEDILVRRQQPPQKSKTARSPTSALESAGTTSLDMTTEAMMLESGDSRPRPHQKQASRMDTLADSQIASSTNQPRKSEAPTVQPRFIQQSSSSQARQKLSRKVIEEENSQAYISPARRKKAAPKPPSPEPDLLFNGSQSESQAVPSVQSRGRSASQTQQKKHSRLAGTTSQTSAPIVSRPKPPRTIPPISSIALQSSTSHRLAGTAAFKLGSYADATASYSSSLRDLPSQHPLTIILLTNRALTHLKTGDPKACIADADAAISLIGPSRGVDESIDLSEEGKKDMAPFWGKAMMRRAEALEQLERWNDARGVWKECIEAGVGRSTSIQGRNRCEKAVGGGAISSQATTAPRRPAPASKKPTPKPAARATSALDDLSGRLSSGVQASASSTEAVTRLRAANAQAERLDDEKFALADAVDERLSRWRKGKETNLRALLGSLDTVLWEGAGWKKVGMSELIVPGRVKVAYMKGIAKVHPDKVRRIFFLFFPASYLYHFSPLLLLVKLVERIV